MSKGETKTPNYHEKIRVPLTDEEFQQKMKDGYFVKSPQHEGYIALLYYSAVRCSEARRTQRKQFQLTPTTLFYDVGERLKHSEKTPPLEIPLDAPYVDCIVDSFVALEPEAYVWPICRATAYNIVHRVFPYPHYFRLSRITNFFKDGWDIASVRSWTGLSLKALDFYVGTVKIGKMGKSLLKYPT